VQLHLLVAPGRVEHPVHLISVRAGEVCHPIIVSGPAGRTANMHIVKRMIQMGA
jgi:hypothetical protein